uniref:Uncharacterized protein n=1 Tax=Romanomermis culicivorax TaxID=13658 RepID=A0A915INR6_ROMCU
MSGINQYSFGKPQTTSNQIRQEIQRFESVHPCIYAIYDLIESIPDALLAHQIRDNVVCIEVSPFFTEQSEKRNRVTTQ